MILFFLKWIQVLLLKEKLLKKKKQFLKNFFFWLFVPIIYCCEYKNIN